MSVLDTDVGSGVEVIGTRKLVSEQTGSGTDVVTDRIFDAIEDSTGSGTDSIGNRVVGYADSNATVTETFLGPNFINILLAETGAGVDLQYVLRPQTMITYGVLSRKWTSGLENKWLSSGQNKWSSRVVDVHGN